MADPPGHIIVPFAPGGTDIMAGRATTPELQNALASPCGGNRRGKHWRRPVARWRPTATSLLMGTVGTASTKSLYSRMTFDPQRGLCAHHGGWRSHVSVVNAGAKAAGINNVADHPCGQGQSGKAQHGVERQWH
jgi:hypothetical protein